MKERLVQFDENLESIGQLIQNMQQKHVSRSSLPPSCFLSQGFSVSYIYEGRIQFEFGENLAQIGQFVQELQQK